MTGRSSIVQREYDKGCVVHGLGMKNVCMTNWDHKSEKKMTDLERKLFESTSGLGMSCTIRRGRLNEICVSCVPVNKEKRRSDNRQMCNERLLWLLMTIL
jgi:hypothetical protein